MPERQKRSSLILICALLMAGTAGIYWRVYQHDFINYDDPDYVLENPQVQAGLTWQSIAWAFTTGHAGNWHPLTWLSHILDWQLFGANAPGHHAVSALFHVVNALLLFFVLRELTGATWKSGVVAALFAWHPLHVESVAWVSERKDVLSTFFFMLTLWTWSRYVRSRIGAPGTVPDPGQQAPARPAWRWYAGALLFFALGLMAKPMLVTLPCLLLLLDYWPFKRLDIPFQKQNGPAVPAFVRLLLVEKAPFFALTAVSCVMTFVMQQKGGAIARMENVSLELRLSNAVVAYAQYLRKTIWPNDLAPFYPLRESYPVWPVILAAVLLLGITALVLTKARTHRYLVLGWFWFLGTLVPVIGIVQVGNQALADRYSYIPLIGVFVVAAWGLADWIGQRPLLRKPAVALGAGGLVTFGVVAAIQCAYWKDSITLFQHALKVTSSNYLAHHSLATALVKAGKVADAKPHLEAAVEIKPLYARAQSDLGLALVLDGKIDEGIEHYRVAISARPDLAKPHYNLGCALVLKGKPGEAISEFDEALRLEPGDTDARAALARALESLGVSLAESGDTTNAIVHLQKALSLQPSPVFHYELGLCFVMQGDRKNAAEQYRLAIKSAPGLAVALNDLAWILATAPEAELRNGTEAVRLAEEACRLTREKEARFLGTLDAAYAEVGRFEDAIRTCKRAKDLAVQLNQTDVAAAASKRRDLYEGGKRFRQE